MGGERRSGTKGSAGGARGRWAVGPAGAPAVPEELLRAVAGPLLCFGICGGGRKPGGPASFGNCGGEVGASVVRWREDSQRVKKNRPTAEEGPPYGLVGEGAEDEKAGASLSWGCWSAFFA